MLAGPRLPPCTINIDPCAMPALGNPGVRLLAEFSIAVMNGVVVSSPRIRPPSVMLPVGWLGSPLIATAVLLEVSGNETPSKLPDMFPFGAEFTISTKSRPLVGSKENGALNGISMSNAHGPLFPLHPDEEAVTGPLKTTVASGPTLLANVVLASVWPLFVLGYACVVDTVTWKDE